jgi:DNA-binding MarR family transcriptional regulator
LPSTLENRLAYRFSRLAEMNLRHMAGLYARKHRLSATTWRILSIIGRYEPVFAGTAAQRSTMEPDKVTRAVDRLVRLGLVVRNTDVADRRRVILCLSSRGRTVYGEIERAFQKLDAKWRGALTAEEERTFTALLGKLETQANELFTSGRPQTRKPGRRASAS